MVWLDFIDSLEKKSELIPLNVILFIDIPCQSNILNLKLPSFNFFFKASLKKKLKLNNINIGVYDI